MRKILARRPTKPDAERRQAGPVLSPKVVKGTLEFDLKRRIYTLAAERAAADGVICGYEEPEALKEARQVVLQDAVVEAKTFEELKAIVTMMLDSDDGLVEGLAEIQQQLDKDE